MWSGIVSAAVPAIMSLFKSHGQGAAASDIENALHGAFNQAQAASGKAVAGLAPFQQAGTSALAPFQAELQEGRDPSALLNKYMGQFQSSPQAQFQEQKAQQAAQNIGSAAGVVGSGAQQKALEQTSQQITSADQANYLSNILGLRGQTMGGLQSLIGGGQAAAGQAGQFLMDPSLANMKAQMGMAKGLGDEASASGAAGLVGGIGGIVKSLFSGK